MSVAANERMVLVILTKSMSMDNEETAAIVIVAGFLWEGGGAQINFDKNYKIKQNEFLADRGYTNKQLRIRFSCQNICCCI